VNQHLFGILVLCLCFMLVSKQTHVL